MSKKLALAIVPILALAACKESRVEAEGQQPAFGPSPPALDEVQVGLPEWDFSSAPSDAVSLEIIPTPVDFCANASQAVAVRWDLGAGMAKPEIWVQGGAGRPKLFAAPGQPQGEAETGPWVNDATIFFLVDGSSGKVLRELRPVAVPCA